MTAPAEDPRIGGRESVTLAEIARQRALGWPDFHPEDFCHQCGRPNPTWFADTKEWREATNSTDDGGGILCPSCFCALWEAETGRKAIIWRLSIDPRSRDTRPAVDRAEPPEGLREAIRECLDDEVLTRTGRSVGDIASGHVADAILALPAVAALLAKLVAVEAFRRWYVDSGHADAEVLDRLRRTLGGPS